MSYPFNKALLPRFEVSDADKPELVELVKQLYGYSAAAKKNGLMPFLNIESEVAQLDDPLLRVGLLMLGDGAFDEVQFEEVLSALLMSEAPTGKALVRQLITSEGLLSIRKGQSPNTLLLLTSAFLGLQGVTDLAAWQQGLP